MKISYQIEFLEEWHIGEGGNNSQITCKDCSGYPIIPGDLIKEILKKKIVRLDRKAAARIFQNYTESEQKLVTSTLSINSNIKKYINETIASTTYCSIKKVEREDKSIQEVEFVNRETLYGAIFFKNIDEYDTALIEKVLCDICEIGRFDSRCKVTIIEDKQ